MKTTTGSYSPLAQFFHWLTAILVLAAFVLGPGGPESRVYGRSMDFDRQLHETLGLAVLALSVLRVLWMAVDNRPAPLAMDRRLQILSKAVQGLLYLLLFVVPVTAIVGAWLSGHPLTLWGGYEIAPLLSESRAVGRTVSEAHGWLGDIILWLAGLHAAAGLYHHWILKDSVLAGMLPGWLTARK